LAFQCTFAGFSILFPFTKIISGISPVFPTNSPAYPPMSMLMPPHFLFRDSPSFSIELKEFYLSVPFVSGSRFPRVLFLLFFRGKGLLVRAPAFGFVLVYHLQPERGICPTERSSLFLILGPFFCPSFIFFHCFSQLSVASLSFPFFFELFFLTFCLLVL